MINKAIPFAVLLLCIFAAAVLIAGPAQKLSFSGFYLDTIVTCDVTSKDESLIDECRDIVIQADEKLSAYNENADVFKINNGDEYSADKYLMINDLLSDYADFENAFGKGVTSFCGTVTSLWNVTGENPKVPSDEDIALALRNVYAAVEYEGSIPENAVLDFGSGAKGFVCDEILKKAAADKSLEEIVFSTGSSSLMYSSKGREFTASVINPIDSDNPFCFKTGNAFISTSGGYERFFEDDGKKYTHIFDIESGYPVNSDFSSVTVVLPCESSNGIKSDLLSTLIFIGGKEKINEYLQKSDSVFSDYGIVTIDNSGVIQVYGNIEQA